MANIMIEWVEDYHGHLPNLRKSKDNATGFKNGMANLSGSTRFNYGNDSAWDYDWEKSGDSIYSEKVDMAYLVSQGGMYGPIFGNRTHNDGIAHYRDVSLGEDHKLKCVVFDSDCVLEYPNYWRSAMRGLRHILSFSKNRNDHGDRGNQMVRYMASLRMSIGLCWARACISTDARVNGPTWMYADYPDQTPSTQSYHEMWQNGFRASTQTNPQSINVITF